VRETGNRRRYTCENYSQQRHLLQEHARSKSTCLARLLASLCLPKNYNEHESLGELHATEDESYPVKRCTLLPRRALLQRGVQRYRWLNSHPI